MSWIARGHDGRGADAVRKEPSACVLGEPQERLRTDAYGQQ
jgi:hypothetical protein